MGKNTLSDPNEEIPILDAFEQLNSKLHKHLHGLPKAARERVKKQVFDTQNRILDALDTAVRENNKE